MSNEVTTPRILIQLEVVWASVIPGLKQFIYVDVLTNEIVDVAAPAPKLARGTRTSKTPTVASRPSNVAR